MPNLRKKVVKVLSSKRVVKKATKLPIGIAEAEAYCQVHDPEPQHARQVAKTALALFDATYSLHGLEEDARRLLWAGALLHDIGYSVNPERHHKASRDLILKSKMNGYSPDELRVVACLARYHRKALPDPHHKIYRDLDPEKQQAVRALAGILRVADGLDRSHISSVESLHCEYRGRMVRLGIKQKRTSSSDISGAIRKCGLFEEVFEVELDILTQE